MSSSRRSVWLCTLALIAAGVASCGSDDDGLNDADAASTPSSVGVATRSSDTQPGSPQNTIAASPTSTSSMEPLAEAPSLRVTPLTQAADDPVDLVQDPVSGDLLIAERSGTIRRLGQDGELSDPLIEMAVATDMIEQGLLGMVFSPDGDYLYTNRVNPDQVTAIEAYHFVDGVPVGDPIRILEVPQPYENHNGGGMAMDEAGLLYIGFGDGGSGGDPHNNGQDAQTVLGSLLRIRPIPREARYEIPADNPFVDGPGAPEVWHFGLRNPWRFFLDQERDLLWIADVGQNVEEEVNAVDLSSSGLNFGWAVKEGLTEYERPHTPWGAADFTDPVYVYDHEDGRCSITGGVVATDDASQDWYLFGDYCSSEIWAMNADAMSDGDAPVYPLPQTRVRNPVAFALDGDGQAYVLDQSGFIGRITLSR